MSVNSKLRDTSFKDIGGRPKIISNGEIGLVIVDIGTKIIWIYLQTITKVFLVLVNDFKTMKYSSSVVKQDHLSSDLLVFLALAQWSYIASWLNVRSNKPVVNTESMPKSGGHRWNVVGWCTGWCAVLGAVDKEGWGEWGGLVPPGITVSPFLVAHSFGLWRNSQILI